MWKEKFKRVCELSELYYGQKISGASEKETESFIGAVRRELSGDMPKEYAEIFRVFNGIEFNGSIIYGIDYELLNEKPVLNEKPERKINGLIENNKIWYENSWQRKYIFLGEGNISWYVYDTQLSEYCELDKPSGERINRYDKAESLLDKIFEDMLI